MNKHMLGLCHSPPLHSPPLPTPSLHSALFSSTAGQYMCYNWRWSVAKSLSCSAHNAGCVAVIDGPKLLLTPFRHMIVPPPMAAHTIHLPSAVNLVAFAPPPNCNDFLVVLASGQVGVFSYDITVSKGTGTGDKLEKKDGQGFKEILRPPHLLALTEYAICMYMYTCFLTVDYYLGRIS